MATLAEVEQTGCTPRREQTMMLRDHLSRKEGVTASRFSMPAPNASFQQGGHTYSFQQGGASFQRTQTATRPWDAPAAGAAPGAGSPERGAGTSLVPHPALEGRPGLISAGL